ncbi:MAG: hypothetical protein ACK41W_03740, partial [Cyanobacteriota bacterium]
MGRRRQLPFPADLEPCVERLIRVEERASVFSQGGGDGGLPAAKVVGGEHGGQSSPQRGARGG